MTLHGIVTESRHVSCACGAAPDQRCACRPDAVHMARVAHAHRAGFVGSEDFAQAIHDADRFSGFSLLLDVTQ